MTRLGRAGVAVALACGGCVSALPTPPTGSHLGGSQDDASVVVTYPPPPARVDLVPDQPSGMKHPVWVDGQWRWRGSRWVWEPGAWVDLPDGFVYAPPTLVYLSDGNLHWFAGTFRERHAKAAASSAR